MGTLVDNGNCAGDPGSPFGEKVYNVKLNAEMGFYRSDFIHDLAMVRGSDGSTAAPFWKKCSLYLFQSCQASQLTVQALDRRKKKNTGLTF